jgi:hypothetical protein
MQLGIHLFLNLQGQADAVKKPSLILIGGSIWPTGCTANIVVDGKGLGRKLLAN